MTDIERRAARILELGRAEPAPSVADMERVRAALRARHLADPALFTASAASASAAGGASVKVAIFKALGLGAALGVGVSVGAYQLQPPAQPEVAPVRSAERAEPSPERPVFAPPRSMQPEPPPSASARVTVQQRPRALPSTGPGVATLEREIGLLRDAQEALHRGAPERALNLLALLDRERPRGAMMEEREAARAIARCRLGRGTAEALASFERAFARSVHAAGVRAACGAEGTTTGDGNGAPEH